MATLTNASGQQRPVILVVDDDTAIRELLSDLLIESGFQVREAGNGREAVDEIGPGPIDLVITDLVMPEQEGLETIRELRKIFPRLKIIAISGYQGGAYLRHAAFLGATATIPKPFSVYTVLETVTRVLEGEDGPGAGGAGSVSGNAGPK